ncbi:phage terminase large subunit [Marinobacter alexandrii]|uniref:PBSX family phage terminase large subunit n=1 Tax=Marinobacter alexandrii TaxID=2570351 RepID=UPI001FFFBF1A|nr:phage terminase large subunit [Marinobacter alexandrii]MCK2149521.1 phage terminase large subunit [Marinobacter alexandrii]
MTKARLELPPKLIPVFTDSKEEAIRYRGAYGGRGSAKTRTFALMSAVRAYAFAESGSSGVILCGREYMNSLEDSSMEEVKQAIRSVPWLDAYFEMGERYIRAKNRRVWYTFCGLRHNLDSIKSKARILLAWVDEAETVSEVAWQKLLPTVREQSSEVWATWNPEKDGSPTDQRFRKNPPPGSKIVELNYSDNPWFPEVLEQERLNDRQNLDDQTYAWIWEGEYRENSEAQVLAGKYRVDEFEPKESWDGPYYGADWGFAKDPTTLVRFWLKPDGALMIEHEAYGVGVDLDDTPDMFDTVPESRKHKIRGDCARPETISHLSRRGFNVEAAAKWSGSVEDGVAWLRSRPEIVIHPRCTNTLREARMWSYKVDRLTGDILPKLADGNEHIWDAVRYGAAPIIQYRGYDMMAVYL